MKKYLLILVMLLATMPLMAQEKPVETAEATIGILRFGGGYVVTFLDIEKMNQKEVRNLIALIGFYKAMRGKKLDPRLVLAINKKMLPKWTKRTVKKVEVKMKEDMKEELK